MLILLEGIDLPECTSISHVVLEEQARRHTRWQVCRQKVRLSCARSKPIPRVLKWGAYHLPFSSPYVASTQVAVHKHWVRCHSRVLQLEPLRRCVPSQPPRSPRWIDGVDAGGGCDRTPNQILSLKILPKMTLQTFLPCGIYNRLIPPSNKPAICQQGSMHYKGGRRTYSWKISYPCSRCLRHLLSKRQQVLT